MRAVALGLVSDTAVAETCGIIGVKPECLIVVGDGKIELALDLMRKPPVVKGLNVIGLEPDRVTVVSNGVIKVPFHLVRHAAIVKSNGVIWIKSNRRGEIRNRVVVVCLQETYSAAADQCSSGIGIDLYRLVIVTKAWSKSPVDAYAVPRL